MTYGIELKNEFGEDVFEVLQSFVIAETGLTVNANAAGLVSGVGNLDTPEFDIPRLQAPYPHVMKPTHKVMNPPGGSAFTFNGRIPWPLVSPESLYFFQIGNSGLRFHLEIDKPNNPEVDGQPAPGLFAFMVPGNDSSVPFVRVDTKFSEQPGAGNYGMQIRGPSSQIWFDSNRDFLSVSEVLFISKAQITSVLSSNATIDIPLRTATPNAYVSAPNHTSFQVFPGGNGAARARMARIRQTAPDNIRIDRTDYGGGFSTNTGYGIFNDLVLIIARNPFT